MWDISCESLAGGGSGVSLGMNASYLALNALQRFPFWSCGGFCWILAMMISSVADVAKTCLPQSRGEKSLGSFPQWPDTGCDHLKHRLLGSGPAPGLSDATPTMGGASVLGTVSSPPHTSACFFHLEFKSALSAFPEQPGGCLPPALTTLPSLSRAHRLQVGPAGNVLDGTSSKRRPFFAV